MGGFQLKVKTKQGQHVVSNLSEDETIGNLKTKISELTQIPADGLSVLIGFPPKPLDLSENNSKLSARGILNGDTLIVEQKAMPDIVPTTTTAITTSSPSPSPLSSPTAVEAAPSRRNDSQQIEEDILLAQRLEAEEGGSFNSQGILLKQVVPSDNSCLFTSIGNFSCI